MINILKYVTHCATMTFRKEGNKMATKTTTIRFNEDEQRIIDLYMEFQDQPFSTVIKEALMEDIADFFDSAKSEEAIDFNKKNSKKYTSKELLKELGID